jgi:flagellar motor switch protein FliN/FliY
VNGVQPMTDSIVTWLAEEWSAALSSALLAMTGEHAETCAGPRVEAPPEGLGWQENLTIAEGARVLVRLPDAVWKAVGARILQAAGLEIADDASSKDAFLEVVRQSLSQVATKVGNRSGVEVELKNGREVTSHSQDFQWQEISLTFGGALPPCAIGISAELEAALNNHARETQSAAAIVNTPVGSATDDQQQSATPLPRNSKTLDLLLEVDLPIGVSFGRTQMRLKEALKLTTGSIVELNRSVTEPVEIIVNNCVIARGEVVVVDGNYGVRILEIISREERLRTLF